MKYSQTIGIIATLALLVVCYLPWVTIESHQLVITGMNAKGTDFGTPARMNIYFTVIMLLLFVLPKVWAKRTNVFIGALNFSWSFRNFIVLSTCAMGECPVKKPGIYALLLLSFIMMLVTFFPKIELEKKQVQ